MTSLARPDSATIIRRYSIAAGSIAAALGLVRLLPAAPVSIFLCAIVLSVRIGGLGPGVLAIALAQLAFVFHLWTIDPISHQVPQWPRQLLFCVASLLIVFMGVSQRRATLSAMHARDQLDASFQEVRELWRRTYRVQDEERRRIARMLHETVAQDLAVLKMQLSRVQRTGDCMSADSREVLAESIALAEQSMSALRTQSYLLYPPFLDDSGLLDAVRWYVTGFARRSGVRVSLDVPDTLERLSHDTELALFVAVQEGLINIHRHAHADHATVRLRSHCGHVELAIEDDGVGMPDHPTGVGLAALRERLAHVGGTLDIESGPNGTTLRIAGPLDGAEHDEPRA